MPKVITDITDFQQTGKSLNVPAGKDPSKLEKPNEQSPAEQKGTPPAVAGERTGDDKTKSVEEKKPESSELSVTLTDEEKQLSDKAQKEIIRAKLAVNEKHRQMKEAQEEAEASDRLAESQYNERKLAEQRAEALENELKELRARQPKADEPKEPQKTDPKYLNEKGEFLWDKYTDDRAEWKANEAIAKERKRQADETANAAIQARAAAIKVNADAARAKYKDFDAVLNKAKGSDLDAQPQHVLNFIFESDVAGELTYHLLKNPDELRRIGKLSPIRGIAELGKVEASLVRPPSAVAIVPAPASVTPTGGPPPPITPLTGDGSVGVQTDPAKMDYKQLRAYERERNKKR